MSDGLGLGLKTTGRIHWGVLMLKAGLRSLLEAGSEVVRSYHHGSGVQRVAGTSEVVPLDAVQLPDVVADGVVDPI